MGFVKKLLGLEHSKQALLIGAGAVAVGAVAGAIIHHEMKERTRADEIIENRISEALDSPTIGEMLLESSLPNFEPPSFDPPSPDAMMDMILSRKSKGSGHRR